MLSRQQVAKDSKGSERAHDGVDSKRRQTGRG